MAIYINIYGIPAFPGSFRELSFRTIWDETENQKGEPWSAVIAVVLLVMRCCITSIPRTLWFNMMKGWKCVRHQKGLINYMPHVITKVFHVLSIIWRSGEFCLFSIDHKNQQVGVLLRFFDLALSASYLVLVAMLLFFGS